MKGYRIQCSSEACVSLSSPLHTVNQYKACPVRGMEEEGKEKKLSDSSRVEGAGCFCHQLCGGDRELQDMYTYKSKLSFVPFTAKLACSEDEQSRRVG